MERPLKTIDTLVDDIYGLVDQGGEIPEEMVAEFAKDLAGIVAERLSGEPREPYLRLSNLGTKCDRRLWLEIRHPELVEALPPEAKLKFLIGDLHEAILLFLARASGHSVEGQQDRITLEGVKGHRDAVIDGVLGDVKSASSFGFQKFEDGLTKDKDDFGYITQLNSYLEGSQDDPLVTEKSKAFFLASDKTLGKITVDIHEKDTETDYRELARQKQDMLKEDTLPPRAFSDEEDGKSGNRKLGTYCSYCPVKFSCWPNLKIYAYSGRPRFLTKVVRPPKVPRVQDEPF